MRLLILLGKLAENICRVTEKLRKIYVKSQFKKIGKNCYLGMGCKFTPQTISLGDNVSIGNGCVIQSTHGGIIIGDHVMFGPGAHVHGGNHIFNEIGCYMDETTQKKIGEDGQIVIGDDVWIGSCAIILKGVHIGRGSIIGAGSIVLKDIPPYSIYVNKVEPIIRKRFTSEEIMEHERKLRERKK